MRPKLILGIETSCDETSAAVVQNGRKILSNVIASQIDIHTKYGGVVPEIASRKHLEAISVVVDEALEKAGQPLEAMDGIAVTYAPGLVGALLVGVSYGKALAFTTGKPLLGVNHIEAHMAANYLENESFEPPYVCLVVSGGHTHLMHVRDYRDYTVLGRTRDDAAGEAFDKVARALGLGYPGGPRVDALARKGRPDAIRFPKVYLEENSLDFSFSGLKSAVLNHLNRSALVGLPVDPADIAASFQQAVVSVLTDKLTAACRALGVDKAAVAGGVACNTALRVAMAEACQNNGLELTIPPPVLCTDNAAMVACRGYFDFLAGDFRTLALNASAIAP